MITITPNAQNDITAALQKSAAPGRCLYLPGVGAPYLLSDPVVFSGVSLVGDPDTEIRYIGPHDVTTQGVPALDFTDPTGSYTVVVRDLFLLGPLVPSMTGGRYQARIDGLRLSCKADVSGVRVNSFDSGLWSHSALGHVSLSHCNSGNNYYGLYSDAYTGGPAMSHVLLAGNACAGLGFPSTNGVNTCVWDQVEFGFSPFGIYQEGCYGQDLKADSTMLAQVVMRNCSFESVGNGAIVSDVLSWDGPGMRRGIVTGLLMDACEGSWNTRYRLPGRSWDWAVAGDLMGSISVVNNNTVNGIPPGAKGLYGFVKPKNGSLTVDGAQQLATVGVRSADTFGVTVAQMQAMAPAPVTGTP